MFINYFWIVIIIAVILYLININRNNKKELNLLNEQKIELYTKINEKAQQQFEKIWTSKIESLKNIFEASARENSKMQLELWKQEYEVYIRQDAINRSQAVITGKVTEHVIPFHYNFPYNPKDIRFIGSPIDLIIFDGLSEKNEKINIIVVEVKSGNSNLSSKQKLIKQAINEKRISWLELAIKDLENKLIVKNKFEGENSTNSIIVPTETENKQYDKESYAILANSTEENSEVIKKLRYFSSKYVMEIEFKSGRIFEFYNVPISKYCDLVSAPNIDRFYYSVILNKYEMKEIR